MRIAILGWGSLVWNPAGLPHDGTWRADGPTLPIEFSRISPDGRLTLIVDRRHGVAVRAAWTLSTRVVLDDAVSDLAARERCDASGIGWLDRASGRTSRTRFPGQLDVLPALRSWCADRDHDAVLWTALPATFEQVTGRPFDVAAGLDYLDGLAGPRRARAVEYLRRAPEATRTPLRAAFRADPRFRRAWLVTSRRRPV